MEAHVFVDQQELIYINSSWLYVTFSPCGWVGNAYISQEWALLRSVTVSYLDWQTFTSEFESHCLPPLYDLLPHLSKKICKFYHLSADTGYRLEEMRGVIDDRDWLQGRVMVRPDDDLDKLGNPIHCSYSHFFCCCFLLLFDKYSDVIQMIFVQLYDSSYSRPLLIIFKHIFGPLNVTLTGTITPAENGPVNNGYEGLMTSLKSSRTETLPPNANYVYLFVYLFVRLGFMAYQPLLVIYCQIYFHLNKLFYFKQFTLA